MAENTQISWCDHTWSPWIGCTKLSPACDGCYAEHLMDTRLGRAEWGPHGERRRTSAGYWQQLGRWNRSAAAAGRVETVFPSLCDPFDNQADPGIRREWFGVIRDTPSLLHLLLTKRSQNIVRMVDEVGFMPENIAFGTTAEDRKRVETNLPALMIAAQLRPRFLFLSAEPLLGDLGDLSPWLSGFPRLGWVITGGETKQGNHEARITHPAWTRRVRDQCAVHGTPYHHKQNGEWRHTPDRAHFKEAITKPWVRAESGIPGVRPAFMVREGKKAAGRLLDGVEHNGMPAIAG